MHITSMHAQKHQRIDCDTDAGATTYAQDQNVVVQGLPLVMTAWVPNLMMLIPNCPYSEVQLQ